MDNRVMSSGNSVIELSASPNGHITNLEMESKSYITNDHHVISKHIVKLNFVSNQRYDEMINRAIIVSCIRLYNEKRIINKTTNNTILDQIIGIYEQFSNNCKNNKIFNLSLKTTIDSNTIELYEMIYRMLVNIEFAKILTNIPIKEEVAIVE